MSILIKQELCAGCGSCAGICPGGVIRQRPDGTAYLPHPEECWGCASCLKECRHGAIFYYLGADIGGRGGLMQVSFQGDLQLWTVQSPGQEPVTITVDRRSANQY